MLISSLGWRGLFLITGGAGLVWLVPWLISAPRVLVVAGTSQPPRGDSNYHALQVKWEKRYSDGLTTLVHYIWSKMIYDSSHGSSDYSWLGGGTNIQNIWDLRGERALGLQTSGPYQSPAVQAVTSFHLTSNHASPVS